VTILVTRCVRFESRGGGRVAVDVSAGFGPLKDFLESDIGEEVTDLRFLVERLRGAQGEPWGFGGNSCHVTVGDDVLVENDFTGQRVVLSRSEFLKVLEDYVGAVVRSR
jgi:hypothetical protein